MSRYSRYCVAILVIAALARLATLPAYPLADTTEARYSEIARLMLVSGDWITPQIEAGVPFWGKPPLSFWLTAISLKTFGLNEFAARLPAFLLSVICTGLLFNFAKATSDRKTALLAAVIFATSGIGFVNAGAVMTDGSLLAATTLGMVAFWRAVVSGERHWGYLFFAALGIGLLAKGPIAVVLTLMPTAAWVLWQGRWRDLWRRLPWLSGPAIVLVIALPWYLLAEQKTPGFLHYFIIGEHWSRFVDSGWSGDLYGSAHAETRGTIWLFWAGAVLPWSVIAVRFVAEHYRQGACGALTDWHRYLVLWAVAPMVFFSLAGNILPAYVLPGLPAFALLLARPMSRTNSPALFAACLIPLAFLLLGPFVLFDRLAERSHRDLVRTVQLSGVADTLVYLGRRPWSASFYSNGGARRVETVAELESILDLPGRSYVVVKSGRVDGLPDAVLGRLDGVRRYGRYSLLLESTSGSAKH